MADVAPAPNVVIQLAQNKSGALPPRPAVEEKSISELGQQLLYSRWCVARANVALLNVLSEGAEGFKDADQKVREAFGGVALFREVLRRVPLDGPMANQISALVQSNLVFFGHWLAYRPGQPYPTLNPFKWKEAGEHHRQIEGLRAELESISKTLEQLWPFVNRLAGLPMPDPETRPAERRESSGPELV